MSRQPGAQSNVERPPRVRVGLLGTSFMGCAHSRGLYLLPTLADRPRAVAELDMACGRDAGRLSSVRQRFGWQRTTGDWRDLIAEPGIEALINTAPNDLHAEPSIAAVQAGKHVMCEKPLARTVSEALSMVAAAERASVVNMTAFNYRFLPAVQLAKNLVEAGELSDILHFQSTFLVSYPFPTQRTNASWRLRRTTAGSGVIGDLLAHHIDLARLLVGEVTAVSAISRTWPACHPGLEVDVDDSVICTAEFAQDAMGTLQATRASAGHAVESVVELIGSQGSLSFSLRYLNELRLITKAGVHIVDVTDPEIAPSDGSVVAGWPRHRMGGHLCPSGATFPRSRRWRLAGRTTRRDLRRRPPVCAHM